MNASYIVIFFFLFLLIYGFTAKSKSLLDYTFSSRKLTVPALVATLVTTWYGGINEIGIEVIHNGITTWIYFGLFYYIAALIYALYIVPRIIKKNYTSIPLLMLHSYGKYPALITTFILFFYLLPAPYVLILGQIISQIFEYNLLISIIISLLFSTLYTLKGGFNSIIKTDQIQFILMFFGFIILFVTLILSDSFGINSFKNLYNLRPDLLTIPGNSNWSYILMFAFLSLLTFLDPSFYQRTFAGKDLKTVKKSILISIIFWFIFDFMTISIALIYIENALSNNTDPLLTTSPYIEIAKTAFNNNSIFMGIFFVSILSVVMSTIDSYTFLASLTIKYDLNTILNRKYTDINSIKLGTILVLSISFLLTQFFDRALYFWYYFGGYLLISTFLPLLCSLFNIKIFRVTKMMLISILLTFIWEFMIFYNISNLPSVYIGLSFSFLWVLMPKLKSYAF